MPDTTIPALDSEALAEICGGNPVCTPGDPRGVNSTPSVRSWSGRVCDGKQSALDKGLGMAHRSADIFNNGVQLDMDKVGEAAARRPPIACMPGDTANSQ